MDSHTPRLRHNALVYESDDSYLERTVPFLKEGVEAGEAAIVAASRDRVALIRDGLGDAAEGVTFVDSSGVYTRPARTTATYYATFLRHLEEAPSVRAIAEVEHGPTPIEWDQWLAYEAIVNHSYAHLPVWVICTYNAAVLPDRVIETAWRTHPEIVANEPCSNPRYEDPETLLRALGPEPQPLPELHSMPAGQNLEAFRERLARELTAAGVSESRALDMLIAAGEVAQNAWQHGGGPTLMRAGRANGRFVCEVTDGGPGFDDPLAGYVAPRNAARRAKGLWVVRQLTWRLEFLRTAEGFTARIWL
jgi:anti-sigma regulatory factor (Ser/Thr protein kinase)